MTKKQALLTLTALLTLSGAGCGKTDEPADSSFSGDTAVQTSLTDAEDAGGDISAESTESIPTDAAESAAQTAAPESTESTADTAENTTAASAGEAPAVTASAGQTYPAVGHDQLTLPVPSEGAQQTEQSAPTGIQATVPDRDELTDRINNIFLPVTNAGGSFSVYVISADGKSECFSVRDSGAPMVSASLIKLYVAAAVYEDLDNVSSQEAYAGETAQLLDVMISQSSNDACNTLVTRLGNGDAAAGMGIVNDFCQRHGYYSTQMNRLMLDFNGLENYTSAEDCCNILRSYYFGELAGSDSVISSMMDQITRTKIPAGITDGTTVANKTGELGNVENDSAIVYAPSGTYMICVMSDQLSDTAAARNAISRVSAEVYNYMKS